MTTYRPVPKPAPREPSPPKPIKARNPDRLAKRYDRDFGEKAAWIRTLCCCVTGRRTGEWMKDQRGEMVKVVVVAAHVKSRGAHGDRRYLVPLAHHLHERQHGLNMSWPKFEATYRIDRFALAAAYEARWQARGAR